MIEVRNQHTTNEGTALKERNKGFYRFFDYLLVMGLAAMVVMVFGNVVLRYVFNSGLEFSEEVSRFVFVWMTFIGSVVALREGLHLGMDTVVKRLSRRGKLLCYWISHLLMLWCCVLLFRGSLVQTQVNLNNFAPVSKLPIAVVYGVGLFAATFMAAILLQGLWKAATGKLSDAELVEVKENEDTSADVSTETRDGETK